jgi:hypothetical protein
VAKPSPRPFDKSTGIANPEKKPLQIAGHGNLQRYSRQNMVKAGYAFMTRYSQKRFYFFLLARLLAFKGLILAALLASVLTWVAKLHTPRRHLAEGLG